MLLSKHWASNSHKPNRTHQAESVQKTIFKLPIVKQTSQSSVDRNQLYWRIVEQLQSFQMIENYTEMLQDGQPKPFFLFSCGDDTVFNKSWFTFETYPTKQ